MIRRTLLLPALLASAFALSPALAETSGPASGNNAQPTSNASGKGDKSMTSDKGSSGAAVGSPGKAGKAGGESDPGTVKPPGQH